MKSYSLLISGLASSFWLMGCITSPVDLVGDHTDVSSGVMKTSSSESYKQRVEKHPVKNQRQSHNTSTLIKITGMGYGAASSFANVTKGQRLLMAIRASKLDAYRSLAEQLYGINIESNTVISTLTAKNDSFRAKVNALVRGARVVSITPMADNNYETVLEVYVDQSFFREAFIYSNNGSENISAGDCHGFNCR